jgi:uncharacterized repeat protein (TIGR03803 family)
MWRNYFALPLLIAATVAAHGKEQLTTLYTFQGGVTDGSEPAADIAMDGKGNIYGTTEAGGADDFGTAYELSPPTTAQTVWTETLLWSFSANDGYPLGGLIRDKRGALYGIGDSLQEGKCGSVWELRNTMNGWKYETLWTFQGGASDGCDPSAALNFDASGTLYGNTFYGGASNDGTVFKLTPPASGSKAWSESVVWSFNGSGDGSVPSTQMTFDSAGNLYGTCYEGGANGTGTAWQLVPPPSGVTVWTRNLIWTFDSITGSNPTRGPMVFDAAGNLYGTAHFGGSANRGTAFELSPPSGGNMQWAVSVVFNFGSAKDGSDPTSGAAMTSKGKIIVPTGSGVLTALSPPSAGDTGWRVFSLAQVGGDTEAPPLLGHKNTVFGTAYTGGTGHGTVWELSPQQLQSER